MPQIWTKQMAKRKYHSDPFSVLQTVQFGLQKLQGCCFPLTTLDNNTKHVTPPRGMMLDNVGKHSLLHLMWKTSPPPALPNITIIHPSQSRLACHPVIVLIQANFNPADSLGVMGRGGYCLVISQRTATLSQVTVTSVLWAAHSPWGHSMSPVMLEMS